MEHWGLCGTASQTRALHGRGGGAGWALPSPRAGADLLSEPRSPLLYWNLPERPAVQSKQMNKEVKSSGWSLWAETLNSTEGASVRGRQEAKTPWLCPALLGQTAQLNSNFLLWCLKLQLLFSHISAEK